jgi:hypothetical protein
MKKIFINPNLYLIFTLLIAVYINFINISPSGKYMIENFGVSSLDSCVFCSSEKILNTLTILGEAGRNVHLQFTLYLDIIFPFSIFGFFYLKLKNTFYYLPFLALFFDLVENTLMVLEIRKFPNISSLFLNSFIYINTLKFIFYILCLLALTKLFKKNNTGRASTRF